MNNISVGSENPVKIKASERGFRKVWPDQDWKVIGVDVESGVSEQPLSREETIQGAKNRAKRAMKKTEANFSVGIEGGIYKFKGDYFDSTWVAVIDDNGNTGVGSTLSIPMPDSFMKRIDDGEELGDVIDDVFDGEALSKKQGYFGLMTNEVVDRTDGYVHGVVSALAPFIHKDLF